MYLAHFELREKPFKLTTDPRFLWLGREHAEALAILRYGVLENKGLLLLTGDIGTGKTTLVSALVDRLDTDRVVSAGLPDPGLTRREFFYLVSRKFGLIGPVHDKETFTDALGEFLDKLCRGNKKALLIIDEIQVANDRVLEEIRLLSNLEYRHVKPLTIFLVGQSEFNRKLLDPANRAIRERIAVNYTLKPLAEEETASYIAHRLQVAGARRRIFTDDALQQIQAFSRGAPRRINILCDLALVHGYAGNARLLDRRVIVDCERRILIEGSETEPGAGADRPIETDPQATAAAAGIETAVQPAVGSSGRSRRYAILALVIFLPAVILLYALWSSGVIKRHLPALSGILSDRQQTARNGDPAPVSSSAAPNPGGTNFLSVTRAPAPAPAGTNSPALEPAPPRSSPRTEDEKAATPPDPADRRPGQGNSALQRPEPAPQRAAAADKPAGPGLPATGMAPEPSPPVSKSPGPPAFAPQNPVKEPPTVTDDRAAVRRKSTQLLPANPPAAEKSALNPSPTANPDPADIINWLLEKKKAESGPAR